MSRFDINQLGDFQRLTLGSAAAITQTLLGAGRNPEEWDILEGSYNGVIFHVFQSKATYQGALRQVRDTRGRRKVKYRFPYRDGQTTDDLGRTPSTFSMEVLIHGNHYLDGLQALLDELDKPTPGDLIHPVFGSMVVAVEDFEIVHESGQRKAAEMKIVFIEHNFTIGNLEDVVDTSVKGALAFALSAFAAIDAAITNITGAAIFALSLRRQILQALQEYKLAYSDTLQQLNKNFNTRGSSDIPGLLPTNKGGTGTPGTGTTFPLAGEPIDDNATNVIPALAASEMTKLVNQRRAELAAILASMIAVDPLGQHDTILGLKNTAISMQDVLEKGIASSKARVIDFITPRDMSLREVAFANSLAANKSIEIAQLNPALDSVNLVVVGTTVRVPIT